MTSAPTASLPLLRAIPLALRDIKLAHSIFALPFAILASFLAAPRNPATTGIAWSTFTLQLILIALCMFFARTWAMLINRLADYRIDAANPRTARRAIASGALPPRTAWAIAAATAAAFIATTSGFLLLPAAKNPWPLILSLPVLAWIALYSYTKRFTALCHLFLGSALAISPIAALIAIDPARLAPPDSTAISIFCLATFVLLWVAGFDIAYALQDLDFDRETSLHSIPARLGPRRALHVSRALHGLAFAALLAAVLTAPRLGLASILAACAVGGLLIAEHLILHRRGVAGLPLAFFTLNGIASCTLGLVASVDALH